MTPLRLIPLAKSWFRPAPAGEDKVAATFFRREPSLFEVLLMLTAMAALHLFVISRKVNFWDLASTWGDNQPYLAIASMIRNWHFSGGEIPQHFWGFSYAIAAMSTLFSLPPLAALVLISMLASLAVTALVYRLYGGWVAATFIFINYEWIQISVEGYSEPLFMGLLFASFLAVRSDRWNLAALLASLSTTVRPVGVFALVCFAIVLARRKAYRQVAAVTLVGLAVGALYVVPLGMILGNPLANFIVYSKDWGAGGWPLTYPFGGLVPSYLAAFHAPRWAGIFFSMVWVVVALAGMVAMWLPRNRRRFSAANQTEVLFTTMYVLFFICYNKPDMVGDLPRFLVPALPLLVFPLRDWIPHDRRVLWAGALLSALLASAGIVGFKNVFGFRLP